MGRLQRAPHCVHSAVEPLAELPILQGPVILPSNGARNDDSADRPVGCADTGYRCFYCFVDSWHLDSNRGCREALPHKIADVRKTNYAARGPSLASHLLRWFQAFQVSSRPIAAANIIPVVSQPRVFINPLLVLSPITFLLFETTMTTTRR